MLMIIRTDWVTGLIDEYEEEKVKAYPLAKQYLEGNINMLKYLRQHNLLKGC